MIWRCYFSSQPCGYTPETREGRVYFSESMVQSLLGRQWEENNRYKPHRIGDVIGHVVKLKGSILDSHLCFTLHQICASITEGCTSLFRGCNSEDFQAVFFIQKQRNSLQIHGFAPVTISFLGSEVPLFCSNFQNKCEKIVWIPFPVCCLRLLCFFRLDAKLTKPCLYA